MGLRLGIDLPLILYRINKWFRLPSTLSMTITVTYSLENSFIVMSPIVVWMTASSGSFLAPSAPFQQTKNKYQLKTVLLLLLLLILLQLLIVKIGNLWLQVATFEERKGNGETSLDVHKCSHMQPSKVWEKGKANKKEKGHSKSSSKLRMTNAQCTYFFLRQKEFPAIDKNKTKPTSKCQKQRESGFYPHLRTSPGQTR